MYTYTNQFLGEKNEKHLKDLKFSGFVNFDDCIGKISSKSIRLYLVFIQKKI